jgi:nucleotide-binding universal stress UspA family protein
MGYERILVAFDGSPASRRALESVARMAGGAQVTVMLSVRAPMTSLGPAPPDPADLERARALLQDAHEALVARGVDAEAERAVGHPTVRILDEAKRRGADLVVVGRRGKRWRLLGLGSVSLRVVDHAPCDVLVVH